MAEVAEPITSPAAPSPLPDPAPAKVEASSQGVSAIGASGTPLAEGSDIVRPPEPPPLVSHQSAPIVTAPTPDVNLPAPEQLTRNLQDAVSTQNGWHPLSAPSPDPQNAATAQSGWRPAAISPTPQRDLSDVAANPGNIPGWKPEQPEQQTPAAQPEQAYKPTTETPLNDDGTPEYTPSGETPLNADGSVVSMSHSPVSDTTNRLANSAVPSNPEQALSTKLQKRSEDIHILSANFEHDPDKVHQALTADPNVPLEDANMATYYAQMMSEAKDAKENAATPLERSGILLRNYAKGLQQVGGYVANAAKSLLNVQDPIWQLASTLDLMQEAAVPLGIGAHPLSEGMPKNKGSLLPGPVSALGEPGTPLASPDIVRPPEAATPDQLKMEQDRARRELVAGGQSAVTENFQMVGQAANTIMGISANNPAFGWLHAVGGPRPLGAINPQDQINAMLAPNPVFLLSAQSAKTMDPDQIIIDGISRRGLATQRAQQAEGHVSSSGESLLDILQGGKAHTQEQLVAAGYGPRAQKISDVSNTGNLALSIPEFAMFDGVMGAAFKAAGMPSLLETAAGRGLQATGALSKVAGKITAAPFDLGSAALKGGANILDKNPQIIGVPLTEILRAKVASLTGVMLPRGGEMMDFFMGKPIGTIATPIVSVPMRGIGIGVGWGSKLAHGVADNVGDWLHTQGADMANGTNLMANRSALGQLVGLGGKAIAQGVTHTLPAGMLIAPNDPAQQGALAGYGIFGHALGTVSEVPDVFRNTVANQLFVRDPNMMQGSKTAAPINYGTNKVLDAQSLSEINRTVKTPNPVFGSFGMQDTVPAYSDAQKQTFHNTRSVLNGAMEIHVLGDNDFVNEMNRMNATGVISNPDVNARGVFVDPNPGGAQPRVIVRGTAFDQAFNHEVAHGIVSRFTPQEHDAIYQLTARQNNPDLFTAKYTHGMATALSDLPTQAGIDAGTEQYQKGRLNGLSQEDIKREMVVEATASLFNGGSIDSFTRNPTLLRNAKMALGGVLAKFGFDPTSPEIQSVLGVHPTLPNAIVLDSIVRDAMQRNNQLPPPTFDKNKPLKPVATPLSEDEILTQKLMKQHGMSRPQAEAIVKAQNQKPGQGGNKPPPVQTPADSVRQILTSIDGFKPEEVEPHIDPNLTHGQIGDALANARQKMLAARKDQGLPTPDEEKAIKKAEYEKDVADKNRGAYKANLEKNLQNPEWVKDVEDKLNLTPGSLHMHDSGALHAHLNDLDPDEIMPGETGSPVTVNKDGTLTPGHIPLEHGGSGRTAFMPAEVPKEGEAKIGEADALGAKLGQMEKEMGLGGEEPKKAAPKSKETPLTPAERAEFEALDAQSKLSDSDRDRWSELAKRWSPEAKAEAPKEEPYVPSEKPLPQKPGTITSNPDGSWGLHVGDKGRVRFFKSQPEAQNAAEFLRQKHGPSLSKPEVETPKETPKAEESPKGGAAPKSEAPPPPPKGKAAGAAGAIPKPQKAAGPPPPGVELSSKGVTKHKGAVAPIVGQWSAQGQPVAPLPQAPVAQPVAAVPAAPVEQPKTAPEPTKPEEAPSEETQPGDEGSTPESAPLQEYLRTKSGQTPGEAHANVFGKKGARIKMRVKGIAPDIQGSHIGFFGYSGDKYWDHASGRGVGAFKHSSAPGSMIPDYSAGLKASEGARRGIVPGQEFWAKNHLYRWDDIVPDYSPVGPGYVDVYEPGHPPDPGVSAATIAEHDRYVAGVEPKGQRGESLGSPMPSIGQQVGEHAVLGKGHEPNVSKETPKVPEAPAGTTSDTTHPVSHEDIAAAEEHARDTIEQGAMTEQAHEDAIKQQILQSVGTQHAEGLAAGDQRVTYNKETGFTTGKYFDLSDPFHQWLTQGIDPHSHDIIEQVEKAIAGKKDLYVTYGSAPQEAKGLATKEEREAAQAISTPLAREKGTAPAQPAGKNIYPNFVGVKLGKQGEPNSLYYGGISPDKVAENSAQIIHRLGAQSPYTPAPFGDAGAATEDMHGAIHNWANGYDAAGTKKLTPVEGTKIPEPSPDFQPYPMSRQKANLWNLAVQGKDAQLSKQRMKKGQLTSAGRAAKLAESNEGYITPEGFVNPLHQQIEMATPGWSEKNLHSGFETAKAKLTKALHTSGENAAEPIHAGHEAVANALKQEGYIPAATVKAGFMPGDEVVNDKGEKERISQAAIQWNGKTFTGLHHAMALDKAGQEYPEFAKQLEKYYDNRSGRTGAPAVENPVRPYKDGFTTSSGRFIDRTEAWKVSRAAKQVTGEAPEENTLDSSELNTGRAASYMPGKEIVSPNVNEGTDFDYARKAIFSQRHQDAKDYARRLETAISKAYGYKPGEIHDSFGDWGDGAENSLISNTTDQPFNVIKLKTAMKALHSAQKQGIAWEDHPAGEHVLYELNFDRTAQQVRDIMQNHDLTYKTIVADTPHGENTKAYVIDTDGSAGRAVAKLAGAPIHESGLTSAVRKAGHGEFIGDDAGSSRDVAATNFRDIIKEGLGEGRDQGGKRLEHLRDLSTEAESSYGGLKGKSSKAAWMPEEHTVDPSRVVNLYKNSGDELHWVPTSAVDKRWEAESRIPPGGGKNSIRDRYPVANDYIRGAEPLNAPRIGVKEDGSIAFTDGRNRFAAMRDQGHTHVPMAIHDDSIQNAKDTGLIPQTALDNASNHANFMPMDTTPEEQKAKNASFMPGDEVVGPKGERERIKAAAIRDPSDHIYTGITHGDAMDRLLEDPAYQTRFPSTYDTGFVTSSGRFIGRDEAWKLAKRDNQIKKGVMPYTYGDDTPQLASENLKSPKTRGLPPEESPEGSASESGYGSKGTPRKDAYMPGALVESPTGERDTIKNKAIRYNGKVWEAPIHAMALTKAEEELGREIPLDKLESGFVTKGGKFVRPSDGWKAAGAPKPALRSEEGREMIRNAAIKFPDGRVHEGMNHAEALKNALADGQQKAAYTRSTDGFTTTSNPPRFLDRENAFDLAADNAKAGFNQLRGISQDGRLDSDDVVGLGHPDVVAKDRASGRAKFMPSDHVTTENGDPVHQTSDYEATSLPGEWMRYQEPDKALDNDEQSGKSHFMPMAGENAAGFDQADRERRTFGSPYDQRKRFEIDDSKAKFIKPLGQVNKLPEVLEHPGLYENYPDLKDVAVVTGKMPKGVSASYNPKTDMIRLARSAKKGDLIHEVQHWIQSYEEYPESTGRGSSYGIEAAKSKAKMESWELRQKARSEFEKANPELNKEEWLKSNSYVNTNEANEAFSRAVGRRYKEESAYVNAAVNQAAPYGRYWRNPGEIEAREAQKRIGMTEAQRAVSPPNLLNAGPLPSGYLKTIDDRYKPMMEKAAQYMPMAGPRAEGYEQAEHEGRLFKNPYDNLPRYEISDHDMRLKMTSPEMDPLDAYKLSDVIDHPLLFKDYPDAKKINVVYRPQLHNSASFEERDPQDKRASGLIQTGNPSRKDLLAHEIQHWIQAKERFQGTGTNISSAKDRLLSAGTTIPDLRTEASKEFERKFGDPTSEDLREKITSENPHLSEGEIESKVNHEMIQHERARADYVSRHVQKAAFDEYQNNAGEAEAREVARRQTMTPQERAANPPFDQSKATYVPAERAWFMPSENSVPIEYKTNANGEQEAVKVPFGIANAPLIESHQPYQKNEDGSWKLNKNGKRISTVNDNSPDTLPKDQYKYLTPAARRTLSALDANSATGTYAKEIARIARQAMKNPEVKAGLGWYSRMRDLLSKAFGENHELFSHLLGVTSPMENPVANFLYALEAYDRWERGDFKKHIDLYQKAYEMKKLGTLIDHVSNELKLKAPTNKAGEVTDAAAMAAYIKHHGIEPLRENGLKYGFHDMGILQALSKTWMDEAKAPKTKNYAGNLFGTTTQATIDTWMARLMREIGYKGHTEQWRLSPASEKAPSDMDFALSQRAFDKAASKIKVDGKPMAADDLQALLWFHIKDQWEKNGWMKPGTSGAEKSSLDVPFHAAFPQGPTGPRMGHAHVRKAMQGLLDEASEAEAPQEPEEPDWSVPAAPKKPKLKLPSMAAA